MAAGMSFWFCAPPPASPARDTKRPKRRKSWHFGRLV